MLDTHDIGLGHRKEPRTCEACRKASDGYRVTKDGTVLCGTHYDEYLRIGSRATLSGRSFATWMAETKYKSCWEARVE